jgi:hypothetical protein
MKTCFKKRIWNLDEYIPGDFAGMIEAAPGKCVAFASIGWNREIPAIAGEMGVIASDNWNGSYHEARSFPMAAVVSRRFSTARRKLRKFLAAVESLESNPDSSILRLAGRALVRPGD